MPRLTRRRLLELSGLGFGGLALKTLLASEARATGGREAAATAATTTNPFAPRSPHRPGRARAVILLMQNGGPSQMDLFDPKPDLKKFEGRTHGEKVEMFQKGSEANKLLGTPFAFHRRGRCGVEMSEVIPHLGAVADELCFVRSMHTGHNNHTEGLVMFNTGKIFPGRPALGSWVSYALGTVNQDLPAYVVLRDPDGYNTSGTLLWQNGWLPAVHRGTELSSRGAPVLNLRPASDPGPGVQEANLELLASLNQRHRRDYPFESDLEARIRNYELAARMQLAAGGALDLSGETEATRRLYGLDREVTAGYGQRCLMARRLIEQGVRFVQVFPPVKPQFQPWDSHTNVKTELEKICAACDQPGAALIQDLRARGLLDETIVVWSGEFGRLPVSQNGAGRDHNRNAFTTLVAGGGFRGGHVHGATDEVGYRAVDDRVSVPDLHATILNQLGLDHEQLTFAHHGRAESLTDAPVTGARVVTPLVT